MRLVDADARVTVQSLDEEHEEYRHDVMTVEQALDFATDEGCPPIIDAIPVEWLEEQAKDNYDYSGTLIRGLLSEWEKEQEART